MIADLMYARSIANTRPTWVVVVVPPESIEDAQTALAAVANGHPFGGRTLALPSGGKLSLAQALDDVFVPADTTFHVMFSGWGNAKTTNSEEMAKWRTAARTSISRAA